ncbi:MAG: serine/threonine-protein kinase, partial [Planctomycetota bacterium]
MSTPSTPPAVAPGTQISRYLVKKKLGAGGMGAVWLARDEKLERDVALKLLPLAESTSESLVKRFRAEAAAAARLKHPNIVGVYDAGEDESGYLFIALEYVDGVDAERRLKKSGPMSFRRTVSIVRQLNEALVHLHEQGLVHRDIKPSNLLVRQDGTVMLTDMGLAKAVESGSNAGITRAGFTVGTVDYMAPEQARGSKHADIRSDLYSLGCTWFHLLTGSPPFPADGLTARLHAHAVTPPPDPRRGDVGDAARMTEAAVAVLQRLMSKKPKDRYQDPTELAADLTDKVLLRKSVDESDLSDLIAPESSGMLPRQRPVVQEQKPAKPGPSPWLPIAILATVGLVVVW